MNAIVANLGGRILAWGLPLLYCLTSIAFYLRTYDSAQVKITLVQMGTTFLAGLWYAKWIGQRRFPFTKETLPLAIPLALSLASGVLSFAHTPYPASSLDEFLRRLFYIHLAFIAMTELVSFDRLRRLIFWVLVATAISTLYGLLQILDSHFYMGAPSGLDPFIWRLAFGGRVFSTFGNPNFFGNFLVIVTPITLALLLKRHADDPRSFMLFVLSCFAVSLALHTSDQWLIRGSLPGSFAPIYLLLLIGFVFYAAFRYAFLGVLFFLVNYTLLRTFSKGAWIGFAAAVCIFLMLTVVYFPHPQIVRFRKLFLSAVFGLILLAGVGVRLQGRRSPDSVRFRVYTWLSTWEMALTHPIWGTGIGSFKVIYPAFRRPQIFHIEAKHNTETDHAENEYLEVLYDEGILGFGIFLWVIITFSLCGLRALARWTGRGRPPPHPPLSPASGERNKVRGNVSDLIDPRAYYVLGGLGGFWAMLVHNFVDVSMRFVSSGIYLWLLAGLIGAMVWHDPLPEKAPAPPAQPSGIEDGPLFWVLRLGIMGVFGALSVHMLRSFADCQGPFPQVGGEPLLWFISWVAMMACLGSALWALWRFVQGLQSWLTFAALAALVYPLLVFWGYFLADVNHNRGIFFSKQKQWPAALSHYEQVVRLNPAYTMAYYFMGNVYNDRWQEGDFERALESYQKARRIAPNYVQSHHQSGLLYLKRGNDLRAKVGPARAAGDSATAQQFENQAFATWQEGLQCFNRYSMLDPVFPNNYYQRAWIYIQFAERARSQSKEAEAQAWFEKAEGEYMAHLLARQCRDPHHPPMGAWGPVHRHPDPQTWANLGNVRFMRENYARAVRAYQVSLHLSPDNMEVMKHLAYAHARLNDQQAAIALWIRIRQLAPADPDVQRIFRGAPAHSP